MTTKAEKNGKNGKAEKVEPPPPPPEAPTRDPLKTIGFESGVAGVYLYADVPEAFEYGGTDVYHARRFVYHGASYEHVADDKDGCWIYRQM